MARKKGESSTSRRLAIYTSYKEKSKRKIIEELIDAFDEIEFLKKSKRRLERELKKYKNSNTPSSANKHLRKNTAELKAKKRTKRGAPKGHKGNTLILTPKNIINLTSEDCGKCNSKNIKPTGYTKKRIVICYQKAKTVVKQYNQQEALCFDCGELSLVEHKDIPEKGIYDTAIQALVNYYKFKARLPLNIVRDVMNNVHGVPMTEPTVLEITRRASTKLESEYKQLEKEIRGSKVVNADETSHSVKGVNQWIWVFCNTLFTLFKFNKERGGNIVEQTLGADFKGGIVSDGWKTYSNYSEKHNVLHQRCWDHIRREVKYECKKKHPDLYKWCCEIYFMVKKSKEYKQEARRIKAHEKCKVQLSLLITHMRAHKNLKKLTTKIENGKERWFTCILHPELPMSNNEAERSIRPFVIIRKIIGCLRSELGTKN